MAYEWDGRDTPSPPPKEPRFWQKLLVKTNTLSWTWHYLSEAWGNRVTGWVFQYRDHPPDSEWDQNLLLLHLKCAKIPLQRTEELSTFTGLIPAQAVKFYHLNSSCSSNWNNYLLLSSLNCRRVFLRPLEELQQLSPEVAAWQQWLKPWPCSPPRSCSYCAERNWEPRPSLLIVPPSSLTSWRKSRSSSFLLLKMTKLWRATSNTHTSMLKQPRRIEWKPLYTSAHFLFPSLHFKPVTGVYRGDENK